MPIGGIEIISEFFVSDQLDKAVFVPLFQFIRSCSDGMVAEIFAVKINRFF